MTAVRIPSSGGGHRSGACQCLPLLVLMKMSPSRPKYRRLPSFDNVDRCSTPAVFTASPRFLGADHNPVSHHDRAVYTSCAPNAGWPFPHKRRFELKTISKLPSWRARTLGMMSSDSV